MSHTSRVVSAFAISCLLALPLAATTVVGTGTAASCTEAALDAAIGEANGTFGIVSFNCGAAPHTIVVTSGKGLANGVIVDGGGKITLSGGNTTRIFSLFQGATVEINNLTLARGFASHGGCLLAHSSPEEPALLSLTRVRFESCTAVNYGGAIAATQANLQVADSVFQFNEAESGGGGAVSLNAGGLALQDSELLFNDAFDQGGALQVWFASVQIAGSHFFANNAESGTPGAGGGAMLLRGSIGTVRDTDFTSNSAVASGGAVFLQDGGDLVFEDDRFQSNFATQGGAFYVDATSRAIVRRSLFSLNHSELDGGALNSGGELHIAASTLYRNTADGEGAGLHILSGGFLDLVSATLVDNFRFGTPLSAAQIAWASGATVNVHNTLLQSPGETSPACSGPGGSFSFSIWPDDSCPSDSGAGNSPSAFVPLRPRGFSCGGAATELTPSYALPPGSFALDRGSCRPGDPTFDQRGMPRPQGAACDVGATEFFVPCDGPFFADGFESGNAQRWSIVLP